MLTKKEGVAKLFKSVLSTFQIRQALTRHWLLFRMEEEDEDSMYAPPESTDSGQGLHPVNGTAIGPIQRDGKNDEEDGEEEGEEVEEDESDSVGAASASVISHILTLLL